MRYFSLFLLLSIMLGGCAMGVDDTIVRGKVTTTEGTALVGANIAVTTTDDLRLVAEGTTDTHGDFTITVPAGEYLITIGTTQEDATYISNQRKLVTGDATSIDVGNFKMKRFEMQPPSPPQESSQQYATQEGALGWGSGCFAIGCSYIKYDWGGKYVCCGLNLCKVGWEKCPKVGGYW